MRTRIKWSRSPPAMEKVGTDSGPRSKLAFKGGRGPSASSVRIPLGVGRYVFSSW